MTDINYFLKPPSWRVLRDGGPLLAKILPAKGSTIKIERHAAGSPKIRVVAGTKVLLKDFKFQKGRLEHTTLDPSFVLIIEEVKSKGKAGLTARVEQNRTVKAPVKKLPKEDITGTWGAEANPGGGGGRGGQVEEPYPLEPQPQGNMTGTWGGDEPMLVTREGRVSGVYLPLEEPGGESDDLRREL